LGLVTSNSFYINHAEAAFFLGILIITFMVTLVWITFALIDALSENELLSKLVIPNLAHYVESISFFPN